MAPSLQRLLFSIVLAIAGIDSIWLSIRHFDVDIAGYMTLAAISTGLAMVGMFYEHIRKDSNLSGMLFGTSFLIAFAAAFAVLNYLLITIAGTRIDHTLAMADRALGVDWPAMMTIMAAHPSANFLLLLAYRSVMPQMAILLICMGFRGRSDQIAAFCLALASGAAVTVVIWTLYPSFGAFSVYDLPPQVESHLAVALDARYAHDLIGLLTDGPRRIAPNELKGLIGFPSFHIVMAILTTWYARSWKAFCVPLCVLNLLVLVSTPIQGGHHVVDVIGGVVVAMLSINVAARLARRAERTTAAPRIAYAQINPEETGQA